jgi:hypothetical protein
LTRLSAAIWAIVLSPIFGLLLIGGIAIRVWNVPANDLGPPIFFIAVLGLLSVLALPFISRGILRRASFEAGAYLDSARYTGSNRIPVGVLLSRPSLIENYMLRMGIPPHGEFDTVRTVFRSEPTSRRQSAGEAIRTLRSIASDADWHAFVGGFVTLGVGAAVAILVVVLEFVRIAAGAGRSASPGSVRLVLFILAAILISVGAPIMYRAIRRISSQSR